MAKNTSTAVVRSSDMAKMDRNQLMKLPPATLVDQVIALRNRNVAALGDGEVFVYRDGEGFVKAVGRVVTLRETSKEICKIQGQGMITSKGHVSILKALGISPYKPTTINIRGNHFPNPHLDYYKDSEGNPTFLRAVTCKIILIGYSDIGNLCASQVMLVYDIQSYLVRDLITKISFSTEAGVILPDVIWKNDDAYKRYLPIPYLFGSSILINPLHAEIKKTLKDINQKMSYASRIAESVAMRRAAEAHPADGYSAVSYGKDGILHLPLTAYRTNLSAEEIENIARRIDRGEAPEEINVTDIKAEVGDRGVEDSIDAGVVEEHERSTVGAEFGNQSYEGGEYDDYDPEPEPEQAKEPENQFDQGVSVKQARLVLEGKYGEKTAREAITSVLSEGSYPPWAEMSPSEKLKIFNIAHLDLQKKHGNGNEAEAEGVE